MKSAFSTMRILRLLPLLALLAGGGLTCASAVAGSVYKCQGPNGQIAFTNRPNTFTQCHEVASYVERKPAPAAAGGKPHSEYRSEPPAAAAGASKPESAGDGAFVVHRGAVYKVVRANGVTEYTNIRPATGATYRVLFTYMATCYACNLHSTINFGSTPLNLHAYSDEIAAAAKEYGIDPSLLRAVIHAESAFKRYAVSDQGAQGLMQLMPGTAADLGVGDPFDAGQNIRGGADYLAQLLKQFNGDEKLATAAYNAGPLNVQKYKGVPPFDETRVYVQRVATLHKRYRAAESPPVAAAAPAAAPRS
ncbi:MAG: lytic transglycosylase domain-containing protein [Xanthomonadaceae bacterium]|nr:lytic transglycosylase domain-containing protein [Xanthomonadaceae bacterium]MDE1961451.1 lytic transglycosylase domain-containing protein [Xanthomonadaceae bacterium]MDE2256468.1 lytic transglycosylase domain-containing protein [Xanthomonadaceae bacterium]